MTERDCKRMIDYFIMAIKHDEELQSLIANAIAKTQKQPKRLITAKAAAEMVGISVCQLYRIKDDADGKPRFSYVKTGRSKSSTLRFNAAKFMDEYNRYIGSKMRKES